jgi:hypothetical protein
MDHWHKEELNWIKIINVKVHISWRELEEFESQPAAEN